MATQPRTRAVRVPGAPQAQTDEAPDLQAEAGAVGEATEQEPSEADILREQLAALSAQNDALAAQLSAQMAEQAATPVVAAPVAPVSVGLPASQKAVQTEKGWIVPPTYGSPVNRAR